jgi:ribonuclease HII
MTLILGIDDAGRGPVLGPMILAGVLIKKSDEQFLKNIGAKDSKLLTPKKRNEIKNQIVRQFKYHIEISEPSEIDNSTNLNYLEAQKAAKIINQLTKNIEEKVKVIIDCPSTNIISWTQDVQKLIQNPKNISLVCEHKADLNNPSVSAASIVAKEAREEEVYKLKLKLKVDFGSGYPADPKTINFIKENFDNEKYSSIIRFSWNTVKKLIKAKNPSQKTLF